MANTALRKLFSALGFALALSVFAGRAFAGPSGPPSGAPYSPSDVILNSTQTAKNAGKTFTVGTASITALTSSSVTANSFIFGDGSVLRSSPTIPNSVYKTTSTVPLNFGVTGSTLAFSSGTFASQLAAGTTAPSASAVFDASSTTRGVLVPRLTSAQRSAIAAPATGLLVFNISSGTFEFWSGSAWTALALGNLTLGTTNGLSLSANVLSLGAATAVSTGALKATDFVTFNAKLSPTGDGSGLTGLTKTQVGLSNVVNVDQTDASNISAGILDTARMGTGTANSAKYLRGDRFWAVLDSTAAGLGNVVNLKQVAVADYTQKGAILVGIGTGTFSVLAPAPNGYTIVADTSDALGMHWQLAPSNYSIYNATATAGFPYGFRASTGAFTDRVTGTTSTWTGTLTVSSNIIGGNLSGTNTGDVTLLNNTGLSLTGQALFLATATASQTGSLTSSDWTRFDKKSEMYPATSTPNVPLGISGSTASFSDLVTVGSETVTGALAASSVTATNLVSASSGTFSDLSGTRIVASSVTAAYASFSRIGISSITVANFSASTVTAQNVVASSITFPNGRTQVSPVAITVGGALVTAVTSTVSFSTAFSSSVAGQVATVGINPSSVTAQSNTFNGNSQLVQTTAGGAYPALSGTGITGIPQFTSSNSWSAGQSFSTATASLLAVGTETATTITASSVTATNLSATGSTFTTVNAGSVVASSAVVSNFTAGASTATRQNINSGGVIQFDVDNSTFSNANTGIVRSAGSGNITASTTTTATTFVRSSMSRAVTLTKSTNALLLIASGEGFNNTASDGCQLTFTSDDVNISTAGGLTEFDNPTGITTGNQPWMIHLLYSPGDTSAHTYRVAFRVITGGTCGLNSQTSGTAPFTVLEIGQ